MNINDKFFSFPPYISVSWDHVSALSLNKNNQISIHLNSGDVITLPELPANDLEAIFKAHGEFLETQALEKPIFKTSKNLKEQMEISDFPIRFAFGTGESLSSVMQHNPADANAADLPEEMLQKIAEISRILAPNDQDQMPKAEPHCNCHHCQIARALLGHFPSKSLNVPEEEISLADLQFQQWDIAQSGEKLFNVINKLDPLENYSVHLGHPVGCTCGKQNCEHIIAVLNS